jgi:predicted dehydrogenase
MNSQESGELVRLAKEQGVVNAVNFNIRYYPLNHHARALVRSGELGDVYIVQGSYLQDWLLLPTDWNWRLEPELGGEMRAVADIGSHWLDLTTFITGLTIESVFADFGTFLHTRRKPTRPVETFGGKLETAVEYVEQPISTEDCASVLIRYEGGARGVMTVSQISAGRKNRIFYEIDGSQAALSWDGERPNELWIGHRERPNELLMKDPSLMAAEVRPYVSYPGDPSLATSTAGRFISFPGGHNEGFPDTFKQLYRSVYEYIRAGDYSAKADFATFEDGHKELLLGEAILRSAREGRWVDVK